MPEPTVCATAVPKVNAATKVEEGRPDDGLAGRQHARRHDRRDRIGGVVEAVDVVEEQRDQDQRRDGESIARLPVLDHDAFEHVRGVFAPVGGLLEEVERLLPFDDSSGSLFLVEQPADRLLVDAVGLVLEAIDFDGVGDQPFVLLEATSASRSCWPTR
jgi:hypothetical protein